MTKRFLTAEQVRKSGEIEADVYGAERTLRAALDHHADVAAEIYRRKTALWRELRQIHGLDRELEYQILCQNGQHEIVEVKKAEDGR